SGVVTKAGRNSSYSEGQAIMGITRFGAYTTHLNIDERYVVNLPEGWSFEKGAAYLVQAMTAYYALINLGNVQKGQKVLIHSGAGGVGLFANRIAKKMGAFTVGTTGHDSKIAIMQEEGYDATIIRSRRFSEDIAKVVPGEKLDLILECIGGKILKQGFEMLAPEGRMVVYGSAHFTTQADRPNYARLLYNYVLRPKIDPLQLPNTNRSVMGFNLIWLYDQVEKMHHMIQQLAAMNLPDPKVGHSFPFADLPNAVRKLRSGTTSGKVVVIV
ncbi:MAG: zinc-binding dehydrogenase, partial [Saprospiraceae bacterium]|nr:zinc-binding dehydrogenase [Saprospiraceae bacterium]